VDNKVKRALDFAMKLALTFRSRVGAVLVADNNRTFLGFNIENYCHKGYHAEETALINALLHGYRGTMLRELYLTYDFHGHSGNIYPMCGHCRQLYWEFTHPNLLVKVVSLDGEIRYTAKLLELYPLPYPKDVVRTTLGSGSKIKCPTCGKEFELPPLPYSKARKHSASEIPPIELELVSIECPYCGSTIKFYRVP